MVVAVISQRSSSCSISGKYFAGLMRVLAGFFFFQNKGLRGMRRLRECAARTPLEARDRVAILPIYRINY